MFITKPRDKKPLLGQPSKKRKITSAIEEIAFDNDARQEYLTGFHKRKLQRKKHAQEEAAKRAREEKIESRKELRDNRKKEVEEHVAMVNKLLRESGAAGEVQQESEEDADEWAGIPDAPDLNIVDNEEEYIDEDRYTTVTVESVNISRDGLEKPKTQAEVEEEEQRKRTSKEAADEAKRQELLKKQQRKKKEPKFRYETKFERQLTNRKQIAKKRAKRPAAEE